jgi:hypothetical protein
MENDPKLTKPVAISKALETNPDLYSSYVAERSGGTA